MALAQLEAETDNVPAAPQASAPLAEPSRPLTQIDVSGVIARWRDRRSRSKNKRARLSRNPHNNSIRHQQRRRAKRTPIKESRESRLTRQDADREGTGYNYLGQSLKDGNSSFVNRVPADLGPVTLSSSSQAGTLNVPTTSGTNKAGNSPCPTTRTSVGPESKEKGPHRVRKSQKNKPPPRNTNHAAMRTATIADELEDDPEVSQSRGPSAAELGAEAPIADWEPQLLEATGEGRHVRFNISTNDNLAEVKEATPKES